MKDAAGEIGARGWALDEAVRCPPTASSGGRRISRTGPRSSWRRAYSPTDLEAMNINPSRRPGSGAPDQFFLWRPFKSSVNHRTYVRTSLPHGARPFPWLGGVSGFPFAVVALLMLGMG